MPTLIDLAITNVPKSLKCVDVLEEGLSYCHHMVCFATMQHVDKMKPREIVYRSYKKFDKDKYMQDMENITFQVCEILRHAPLKRRFIKGKEAPYMISDGRLMLRTCSEGDTISKGVGKLAKVQETEE